MKEKKTKIIKWEYDVRTAVFALISMLISVGFAMMNLATAIREHSVWYGSLTAYYVLLILFRAATILADRASKRRESAEEQENMQNKIYLACGAFLVIVEIAMSVAVALMILHDRPVRNGFILTIATAAYTFYKITMAIVNLVKAKKYASPAMQALRNLNFADACMSMTSATVLMLAVFDDGADDGFALAMKAVAGFAACAAVLIVATVMIVKTAKKLKSNETQ